MSDKSEIGWTDATWNVLTGCTRVSPGCAHCYIERTPPFRGAAGQPRPFVRVGNASTTRGGLQLHLDRLDLPLRWRRPRRIFVNSLSDLFHDDVPDELIDRVFAVMALAPMHTFQVLTKRPERMRSYMTRPKPGNNYHVDNDGTGWKPGTDVQWRMLGAVTSLFGKVSPTALNRASAWHESHGIQEETFLPHWPLPNVWLGVSVENQHFADERIPLLLATPAAVRFISAEPLLGPVDLGAWLTANVTVCGTIDPIKLRALAQVAAAARKLGGPFLDWVIVGGESGNGFRPMPHEWVRSLRDQCTAADVPFFFKQWGGPTPKSGGRWLDGRLHDEMPVRSSRSLEGAGATR
jgi:protein gp37